MAKKKKKEIAGVSYKEWIKRGLEEPAPKYKRKKYSNKALAFLDVLGVKALIYQYKDGDAHIAIDTIEKIGKIAVSSIDSVRANNKIESLYISDSFVFVAEPDIIISLLKLLATIQIRIINECHLLLRGAITIGDVIMENDGKQIIGPAYIQAYQLQENDAIYPRIIVDNSVLKEIKKSNNKIKGYLRQDSDKEYFIDYIEVAKDLEPLGIQDVKTSLRRNKVFTELIGRHKKHNEQEEHGICQKYGWTIQYYKNKGVWENG